MAGHQISLMEIDLDRGSKCVKITTSVQFSEEHFLKKKINTSSMAESYTNFYGFSGLAKGGVIFLLGLMFFHPSPSYAQVKKVTAGEVVDQESLKGFVNWVVSQLSSVSSPNELIENVSDFRIEGSDFNMGNTYIILLSSDGYVLLHGEDPLIDGKNVRSVEDDNGTKIFEKILTADDEEGKFVEYCWDDPIDPDDVLCKYSFAKRYYSEVTQLETIALSGYYQDLSGVDDPLPSVPLPKISASEVVDRVSLKRFVKGSTIWIAELLEQMELARVINQMKIILREEGGHFRQGPIYLYIINPEGYVIFHGANPWREGRTVIDNTDFRGTPFIRDLIKTAQSGGGFFEYYWDDPTVEGDEVTGTPKIGYAIEYKSKNDALSENGLIIAAGFYWKFSTSKLAQVQFIHNLPLDTPVNLYLSGAQILEDFQYQNSTGYDGIAAGNHTLRIHPMNTPIEQSLSASIPELQQYKNYVITVHGSLDAPAVKVIETETKSAVDNMIDVILVHGSSDLGQVDLRIIDPVDNMTPTKLLANNFSFNDVTHYITLEPGLYNIQVTTPRNRQEEAVFHVQVSHKYKNETIVLNLSGNKNASKDAFNALKLYGVDIRGDEVPTSVITDIETEILELPIEFALHGNYPNPFNPSTQIRFDLPESAQVSLQVVDMLGREVMRLPAKEFAAGSNRTIDLNASNLSSGTYLYRMIVTEIENRYVKTGRMTLMK